MANGVNRNTTSLTTLKRGTSAISKILRGTTLIWENFISMTNGYLITWTDNGTFYSATGNFKPQTVTYTCTLYNGSGNSFQVVFSLYGLRADNSTWEVIAQWGGGVSAYSMPTFAGTVDCTATAKTTLYKQLRFGGSNRGGNLKLATYLERGY